MRNKIIKTFGFIILSNVPLMTMAISSSSASSLETTISKINQTFKTKLKTKLVNNWVTETKENSNSNITDGYQGVIFEDSRGNLWTMGYGTPLQKYNYDTKQWGSSSKNNITDGQGGVIFEDSKGNLWSMGNGTSLQKYNYVTKQWGSSSKSNITNGKEGVIFEDSRGNLWSMGNGTSLQKYNYVTKQWGSSSKSNITSGEGGVIFEDSRGNLWSMGYDSSLQKYNYVTKQWGSSSKSNITSGEWGVIFEDSRGNLWAMGNGTSLQKYNYVTKQWGVSNGNNIIDGLEGVIFEDSKENLWSVGDETPLQKYDYSTNRWKTFGYTISDKDYWKAVFEDSQGNLWSMGEEIPLQKYDYSTNRWKTVSGSNSNITDGQGGVIFEDSRGNLWSMGNETKLQKLTSQNVPNVSDQKTKNFDITFTTRINADDRIAVLIKGYRKYTSNKFTHLKYRKKNEPTWKIVKDKIMILDKADYEFEWVIGIDESITSDSKMPEPFEIKNGVLSAEIIITITNLKKENFSVIGFNNSVTIKLKKDIILPLQVEPRYYVGSKSNPDDSDYTNDMPLKISNDDIVKIKFFIKKENINTHKFPDNFDNKIEIKVAGLQEGILIATKNLKEELFSFTGFNRSGTIKIKANELPIQIEPKYYVGSESNPNDKEYTIIAPTKLSNDDTVKIKFFIKEDNFYTHKFPDDFTNTPITITVTGLIKIDIATKNLKEELFSFTGFNRSGTIKIKANELPIQIEPKYYVGSESNPNDKEYTIIAPTKLSNDDTVKIKFFIKEDNFYTHKFPDDFTNTPITITVTGLIKIDIATKNLKEELFSFTGFNSSGTIKIKANELPLQIEPKYYVGSESNPNDKEYIIIAPTKLSNDDIVKIKFFIKEDNFYTHKFPDDFINTPITITVIGLKKIDIVTTNLKKELFSFTGFNSSGTIKIKANELPLQIEPRYYVGSKSNPNNKEYTINAPIKLNNDDTVKLKFFIKNEYINTHQFSSDFDNTPITIKVTGLNNKNSNKESSGTTIGIIIGSVAGAITLGILIYYLIKRKKEKKKKTK